MIFLILGTLALLAYCGFAAKKPSDMPPGSYGYPFIGQLPRKSTGITEHLRKLKKKHGKIFTTKWGSRPIVVLADYDLIKKAYNHPEFQGRPHFKSFEVAHGKQNAGIADSDGTKWSENRRLVLRLLRDLGMGKTVLESSIQDEAAMLVDHLEKTCLDKPSEMDLSINSSVLNVIWQMLASKRYDCDDEEGLRYSAMVKAFFTIIEGPFFILNIFPRLERWLPKFILNKAMKVDILIEIRKTTFAMFKSVIEEHKETVDPDNPRDIVDHFLLLKQCTRESKSLAENELEDLMCIMIDMFAAGTDTTASTIRFFILYMAIYQDIQSEIHRCLDEVVPKSRLPSIADRNRLQYIDAVILDVLRLSSLAPVALLHRVTSDVLFEGYTIPEDTAVLACTELCHRDPEFWEKPDVLHPEHFLDDDGNLIAKRDGFLPFSIGRRQCLGESLARMELYLFITAILQRFKIEPPEGVTLTAELDKSQRLLNIPKPYQVVLRRRI